VAEKKRGGLLRSGFSFVLGSIAGVVGGLLLAPRSGKETCEKLKVKGENLIGTSKKDILDKGEKLKTKISEAADELKKKVEKITEVSKEEVEKAEKTAEKIVKPTQKKGRKKSDES